MTDPALMGKIAADPSYVLTALNEVLGILGTNKTALWPFWEGGAVSTLVGAAPTDLTSRDEAAARNLDAEWTPRLLRSGVQYMLRNVAATNNHFTAGDHADYSHGNGTLDTPFSVGIWLAPQSVASLMGLISKYDSVGGAEEFAFRISAAGKLELELHDASASTSELATSTLSVDRWKMGFYVATYDGLETSPTIKFYKNGTHDGGDGSSVETGAYVAMENTATPLLVASTGVSAAPTEEYDGWLALPFITGKELTAAEVAQLYGITRHLLGA